MPSAVGYAGQALVYAGIAAFAAYFASNPVYRQVPPGMAQIKLALRHGAARLEDCRKMTAEELSKLPPNQRRPNDCSRERVPVAVELRIDGGVVYAAVLEPGGLSRDGPAQAYVKVLVPAGRHFIEAKLRDSKRREGFDYEKRVETDLKPWQNLAIDFNAEQGGFLFR